MSALNVTPAHCDHISHPPAIPGGVRVLPAHLPAGSSAPPQARIKLNLKNLYAGNGFAVRELLKLASLLHDAHRDAKADDNETDETMPADIGPGHKFADLKLTRSLAGDITKFGSRLYELLGSHAETKDAAARALGKNFDVDTLSEHLRREVQYVEEKTNQLNTMLQSVSTDEKNLQAKIEKKKQELIRHKKRLDSLQTVRPAFMDEYERLEQELSGQYALYVQSWRNLSYLENELDTINMHEQEKIAENDRQLKHMQKRLREEELRILRGQAKVDEKALDDALLASNNGASSNRAIKRPGAASTRRDNRGAGGGEYECADMHGAMSPMEEDSGEDGEEEEESGEEDEGEESDGQASITQPCSHLPTSIHSCVMHKLSATCHACACALSFYHVCSIAACFDRAELCSSYDSG